MSDIAFVTDGTFAAIGLVLGLINMGVNHCPDEGCLAKTERQAYLSSSVGSVHFQENDVGEEVYVQRQAGLARGPFGLAYGASITEDGGLWAGLGTTTTFTTPNDRWYTQFHIMPGLYAKGDEADLGGPVIFRSGVEVGYTNREGVRTSLSFDHRSNAGLYSDNPGLETVQFRVSVPTN
jgi:lipid A 3-O-deacylase